MVRSILWHRKWFSCSRGSTPPPPSPLFWQNLKVYYHVHKSLLLDFTHPSIHPSIQAQSLWLILYKKLNSYGKTSQPPAWLKNHLWVSWSHLLVQHMHSTHCIWRMLSSPSNTTKYGMSKWQKRINMGFIKSALYTFYSTKLSFHLNQQETKCCPRFLNDSWPCTDDSLWEIKPTSAYTNVQIYCIILQEIYTSVYALVGFISHSCPTYLITFSTKWWLNVVLMSPK